MKTILLIFLFISITTCKPPGGWSKWKYQSHLSDEFSMGVKDIWIYDHPYWDGPDQTEYVAENCYHHRNDQMRLVVSKKNNDPLGRPWKLGYLRHKHLTGYGYYEVISKTTTSKAISSFFLYRWTENATYEVDVYEIGGDDNRKMRTNYHYYKGNPDNQNEQNTISSPKSAVSYHQPLGNKQHRYGLEWTAQRLRFYFNDQLVRDIPNPYFHETMYVHFTSEVRVSWFGVPTSYPAYYDIEAFRYYKRR